MSDNKDSAVPLAIAFVSLVAAMLLIAWQVGTISTKVKELDERTKAPLTEHTNYWVPAHWETR